MNQHVYVPTKIQACADADTAGYTLGGVYASPGKDGEVFLASTDSRCLAVVKTKGHLEKGSIIPQHILRLRPKQRELPISFDGKEWRNGCWRYGVPIEGKFPRYPDVLPTAGKRIVLSIDARLLLNLADAIGDGGKVTLLIENDSDSPEGTIGILGEHGIGALMPFAHVSVGGKDDSPASDRAKYESLRKEIVAAYKPQVSAPASPPHQAAKPAKKSSVKPRRKLVRAN